jgi:hypothetical protein
MNNFRNKLTIFISLALLLIPSAVIAQTINSGNYQIEGSTFDGGGEPSNSANYSSRDSIGGAETGNSNSANYKNPSGFQPGAYPGIPGTPTLTNTGGILYDSLDFVISTGTGQQSDTTYAIAISNDNFATTYFIQTDDTLGANEAWQTYAGWNSGTGELVTGLTPGSTYKIKVKASYGTGSNAADSESGYSAEASASTTGPSLLVSISGINSGVTIAGVTTTVTSTPSTMGFGSLTVGDAFPNIAAQKVTVTTNASGGYTTTVQQDGDLSTNQGDSIAVVSGTNASPSAFGVGVLTGRFGYHTTDSSLCTGSAGRFSVDDTYAALSLTTYEVGCSAGPVTSEETDIVYKLVVGDLQEAGNYQNIITYITTATY